MKHSTLTRSMLRALFISTLLLIPSLAAQSNRAEASEKWIKLEGRILETCQFFTTWTGDFELTYSNNALPWGSSVEVLYGFHGWTSFTGGENRDWQYPHGSELHAVSPYTWHTDISEAIASRGQNWFDQLQFVLKVTLPDGQHYYEKGNNSTWGFYSTDMLREAGRGCVGSEVPFKTMTVVSVERE